MNYDFSPLNDKEFEVLAVDLLSKFLSVQIERFKPGKDQGIDGRFFSENGGENIIQCKHYSGTAYRTLISKLKSDELAKVKKLNPEKYFFITSLPLSPHNKKEIKKIFRPFIKNESDIFGRENLNDLLSTFPELEIKHYKLWISSTHVFNQFLNGAICGRSTFHIEQLHDNHKKYVLTENHKNALNILNEKQILIITGEPGIGKTTLANYVALSFISQDFNLFVIQGDLSEAENVFQNDAKQIFYYDDFLGSNYLTAIEGKKDSYIVKFMERIKKRKNKKFILTSRTNILNNGIFISAALSNANLKRNEYLLEIKKLTELDKARILYNHIWHSNLESPYKEELYANLRYMNIIKHKNFNPRLIEFITDQEKIDCLPEQYWDYIEEKLKNPADIWENCFSVQSDEFLRNLVILTVLNGNSISEDLLRESYGKLIKIEEQKNPSHIEKNFESVIKLATKSFLNRTSSSKNIAHYTLFNPSIGDFILSRYQNNTEKLINAFQALHSVESLEKLSALKYTEILSKDIYEKILNHLRQYLPSELENFDYNILLAWQSNIKEFTKIILTTISKFPNPINKINEFLLLVFLDQIEFPNYQFLQTLMQRNLEKHEIDTLICLYALQFDDTNQEILIGLIRSNIENLLSHEIVNKQGNLDISSYIQSEDGYFNKDEIREDLYSELENFLNCFDPHVIKKLDIDLDDICNEIDIDEEIEEYYRYLREDQNSQPLSIPRINMDQEIHDLFERT